MEARKNPVWIRAGGPAGFGRRRRRLRLSAWRVADPLQPVLAPLRACALSDAEELVAEIPISSVWCIAGDTPDALARLLRRWAAAT